jgi:multiple antibiotic resistance protein
MFKHAEAQFALLAFSSLFSVINPISAAPIFVVLTEGSPQERRRVALRACIAAAVILAIFAAAGGAIFTFFGITVPAFQIAGGIIFTIMSMRALETGREDVPLDELEKADPSVVPLGIPIIAGPGAISTVMILIGQAQDETRRLALGGAILVNVLLTFLILLAAPAIVSRIGLTGQRIIAKIMGLITAVIGVQFVINGVTTVAISILRSNHS